MKGISFSGGIAVGKSTLVRRVASMFPNYFAVEEHPESCPFINEFYADRKRWAFHSRIGMLKLFLDRPRPEDRPLVLDRTLHELLVFARVQLATGALSQDEFELYLSMYDLAVKQVRWPTAVVWVRVAVEEAEHRLRARARNFELAVDRKYLETVDAAYEAWIGEVKIHTRVLELENSGEIPDARLCQFVTSALAEGPA